jgi:hypothetical protein
MWPGSDSLCPEVTRFFGHFVFALWLLSTSARVARDTTILAASRSRSLTYLYGFTIDFWPVLALELWKSSQVWQARYGRLFEYGRTRRM